MGKNTRLEFFFTSEAPITDKCKKYVNPRTTDTQREFFFKNLECLAMGRHFGLKFFEAFWVF